MYSETAASRIGQEEMLVFFLMISQHPHKGMILHCTSEWQSTP
jgi:hypothetical protein